MKYAFVLGREYKLSLAELIAVFGRENLLDFSTEIAIFELENSPKNIFHTLGGTTRIIEIIDETSPERFPTDVIDFLEKNFEKNTKFSFALANFGIKMPLSEMGMRMKKNLQKNFHIRFLNAKNENIHSAVFKREKLGRSETEFAIIRVNFEEKNLQKTEKNNFSLKNEKKSQILNQVQNDEIFSQKYYFGKTIACQDIDAYARRDTGKNRDMIVGMMPPKLVQMMINLATASEK